MKSIFRRFISFVMAVLMLLGVPLQVFAETTGKGIPGYVPTWTPGSGGIISGGNPNSTYADYGFRITFTDSHQIEDSLTHLSGAYTKDDLKNQKSAVESALGHVYIEPGTGGIYFYNGQYSVTPYFGVSSSIPSEGLNIKDTRIKTNKGVDVTEADNELAWYCYPGIEGGTRQSSIECDNDMYQALMQATDKYGAAGDYLYDLRQKFMAKKGFTSDAQLLSYLKSLLAKIVSDSDKVVPNMQRFSWDTENNINTGVEVTPSDLVKWSRIGYLTMLIQFAWYAQLSGNTGTYSEAETLLWNYVQGGYASNVMPLLEVEMCQLVGLNGDNTGTSSKAQLITLPYTLSATYDRDIVQNLYAGGWTGDMREAIAEWVGTRGPNGGVSGWVSQGFGGNFSKGQWVAKTAANDPSNYRDRHYLDLLYPSTGRYDSFGYVIAFTYDADVPDWESGIPNNTAQSAPVPGSFTWKLTPSGVNDMTPDTEVNESSTVYEINMSQNGVNSNNYDKWKTYVQQYGGNNNQLRLTVLRTSEDLGPDDKAKKYTREQVLKDGKNVTEGFDRVIVGDAKIQNIPVIGELKSGEAKTGISNDDLLTILDQAKTMMVSETIKGSLETGIRVSYAVRVEVKVGNKAWQDFTNNQAEFVEYRSNPGLYSYKSNAPDGFAEIKCGYFKKGGYKEPFEAMAGAPTTEDLYFVSGGQEFVAQLTYQYTQNKTATREYEQRFSAEQCDGYWGESRVEFNNATVEDINEWFRKYTDHLYDSGEWINESKPCSECGTVHHNGVGNETIQVTDIDPDLGDKGRYPDCPRDGDTLLKPGPYYSEIHLKGSSWDWCIHQMENSHREEYEVEVSDGNGGSHTETETEDVECVNDEVMIMDMSDKPTATVFCDYGGDGDPDTHEYGKEGDGYWHKERVRRYTGYVSSYHVHFNNNERHEKNQSVMKWTQSVKGMNYAKIKEAHVWRLEESHVNGIRQITFKEDDDVFGTAYTDLADVVFNVAENDTAKEGRMWYTLHPNESDSYKSNLELKTKGCCACFNHVGAQTLLDSKDNPNNIFEDAWCISDYLILNGYNGAASLLYHEYNTKNKVVPILSLEVSDDKLDNGYTVKREKGVKEFRGWEHYGEQFGAEDVYFNPDDATEDIVCRNKETFAGAKIKAKDLSWAGYNGNFDDVTEDQIKGTTDIDSIGKYSGKSGANNFTGVKDKKIFKDTYAHEHQGEVNDFETGESSQEWNDVDGAFVLTNKQRSDPSEVGVDTWTAGSIKPDKDKVTNGRKKFSDSTVFYHNMRYALIYLLSISHLPTTKYRYS